MSGISYLFIEFDWQVGKRTKKNTYNGFTWVSTLDEKRSVFFPIEDENDTDLVFGAIFEPKFRIKVLYP